MLNKRWLHAIGTSAPIINVIVLSGILGASVSINTNIMNTGVTLGGVLIALNLFLAFLIYKKHI